MNIEEILQIAAQHVPGIQDVKREYSVLMALAWNEPAGEYALLYEVRSDHIDSQPGEICFPGGEREPGETAKACALRETREEIGIPEDLIDVCCELDTFHPACGIVIRPFLATLKPGAVEAISPSPDEVKDVFFVPLSVLKEVHITSRYTAVRSFPEDFPFSMIGIDHNYNWRPISEELVVYRYGRHVIWGYTALMTRALMHHLSEWDNRVSEGEAT